MAKAKNSIQKALPYLLFIGGLIGLLAAFILTVEKIELIKNPAFNPSCNINPVLSCGSVMGTPQAEALGVANSLLGIIGFTAVAVTGAALLAGATFKRWFWIAFNVGMLLATLAVHWLIFETIFRINALCPYCMVVWIVTIPMFWYTLLYSIQEKFIVLPKSLAGVNNFVQKHHGDILFVWYLGVLAIILNHFWYYWKTLI